MQLYNFITLVRMESESKYHDLEKEIYLFINSSSGGGVGK